MPSSLQTRSWLLALILGAGIAACGSDRPAKSSEQGPTPDALDESRILVVFLGTDARAMAELGRKLDGERPALSTGLLENMLAFLAAEPDRDPQLRMMRAMLFRSTAVAIGPASRPTLSKCASSVPSFSRLCEMTIEEIGY